MFAGGGKPFREKGSPSPRSPHLSKTFYSGPCDCVAAPRAAIPLRSPGAVEGLHGGRACVPAVSPYPCRRVHPCSGQTAQSAFRKASGNRLGAGTGRRKRDKGSGQSFRLPGHDGQPPGTANSLDKSCAMVCHKSRKFLFFWASSLPNIFSLFSRNVQGLPRWNIVRSDGKNKVG